MKLKFRYISRIDSVRTKCWFVRVGILHLPGKAFSDNIYGNKIEALLAAIEYRNEILGPKYKKLLNYTKRFHRNPSKRNKSTGIIGVMVHEKKYKSSIYYSYRSYFGSRPQKCRYFSWNTWGKEEALNLAILQRREWEKEHKDNFHNLINDCEHQQI